MISSLLEDSYDEKLYKMKKDKQCSDGEINVAMIDFFFFRRGEASSTMGVRANKTTGFVLNGFQCRYESGVIRISDKYSIF